MYYIDNWNDVKDDAYVIEDTYSEVYQIYTLKKCRYLRHVGFTIPTGRSLNADREIDFEPNCIYDQPWLVYAGPIHK